MSDPSSDYLLRPSTLPTWRQRAALRVLQVFGWQIRFKPLPGPHGIAVVYPHTSNWDFCIGLLSKWAMGVPTAGWRRSRCSAAPPAR